MTILRAFCAWLEPAISIIGAPTKTRAAARPYLIIAMFILLSPLLFFECTWPDFGIRELWPAFASVCLYSSNSASSGPDDFSGNPCRLIGGEKDRQRRDVLRLAQPLEHGFLCER